MRRGAACSSSTTRVEVGVSARPSRRRARTACGEAASAGGTTVSPVRRQAWTSASPPAAAAAMAAAVNIAAVDAVARCG